MTEHFDVLIVGAGLSGIGAAWHVQDRCPGKTYAVLEARERLGGTWDLFQYPGIRSDSDMFTLGYRFKPWTAKKAIADGPDILAYVTETAREAGIDRYIRFGHKVVRADYDSATATWTVTCENGATLTCNVLLQNSGYYRYDEGYTPHFEGRERFRGQIIHPQHWPENLDYAGKRVVIIGSGATAVTLVPAMAETAAHVTMLQRSPTYIIAMPGVDPVARLLNRLPARLTYPIMRWKNVGMTLFSYQLSQRRPNVVRKALRRMTQQLLPEGYDVDTHFNPKYDPWDQRLCLVPDGDLFRVLRKGTASIATDTIRTFTETGIELDSGETLEADIIITATGLNLLAFGGTEFTVDGEAVSLPDQVAYKGMMLTGLPNFIYTLGYTNASWTLKADLVAEYACRLINHLDEIGAQQMVPVLEDPSVTPEPFLGLASGYILRSLDKLPKQGSKAPWKLNQNYPLDLVALRHGKVDGPEMRFAPAGAPITGAPRATAAA